jgi:hypothetical protein
MDTQARSNATRAALWLSPRLWLAFAILAIGAAAVAVRPAAAQNTPTLGVATAEELQKVVGPIALYPDDLVAIVLPASTYPLQIVQAARFLEDRKRDSSLQPDEEWDDSIVALLNYPEVVQLLNDDLDWTYDLGTAVLNQRADVLAAIQDFRDEAYAAGNLRSDERQTVAREDDTIEIKPADPQVIYVPYYEPERVVVYQPAPVYYYYPRPYPVYYYPYPAHYRFHTGLFWGVNTWFSIGWHSHHVHAYDPFYHGHPYYGWSYYNPFYVRNVYVNVNHYHRYPNYVWEPKYRYGSRPVVRGSEGRVYAADRAGQRGVNANGAATRSSAAATRTREGSAYRAAEGTRVTTARAPDGTLQPRRDATPTSGYRDRNAVAAGAQTRASTPAQTRGSTPAVRTDENPRARALARAQSEAGQPGVATQSARPPAAVRENPVARPSAGRANPTVSPRAFERSTGMPRESGRAAEAPRAPAPSVSAPRQSGAANAQRGESGGSYRGNAGGGNGSGGSYRGGGDRSPNSAARHTR